MNDEELSMEEYDQAFETFKATGDMTRLRAWLCKWEKHDFGEHYQSIRDQLRSLCQN